MIVRRKGILFIVSAPSGAGKSTLCEELSKDADFVFSVSCTTRPARPGEVNGEDYYFISEEEFRRRVDGGEFLEWAEVHGRYYGTLKSEVTRRLDEGVDVLLDIDIQGARRIRETTDATIREAIVDVFILPPSMQELHRRLLKRGTERPEEIEVRLGNAAQEIASWSEYQYAIVTGLVEDDVRNFRAIMRAERSRTDRMVLEELS